MEVDVVIVGAGPAGSAAAYDLAYSGLRVIIVDRKNFPRDKACGGGLTHKSIEALRYPLDSLIRSEPSVLKMTRRLKPEADIHTGGAFLTMVTRLEFDNHALQQAISVGAQFIKVPKCINTLINNGNRSRIEWDGLAINTRWIIAADGANSQIRRITDHNWHPPQAFALEAIVPFSATKAETCLDFGVIKDGYGWVFPKGDHLNIGLYTACGRPAPSKELLNNYIAQKAPGSIARQYMGGPIPTHCYKSESRQGHILYIGDAAGFSDNLFGEGIYGAIVSGQMAAAAIIKNETPEEDYDKAIAAFKGRYQYMNMLAKALYQYMPLTYPLFHWHMTRLCKHEGLQRKT
ncbi:geranylgeranyl reductase family protein [Alcanivorax sp. 1008]|uniref:geranylgeranyl reductase family protein n=1 Tax=Alcanivorax sp. 1008 TaxID=2816853 RepID=UPI001D51724D|nr:geranylgeranyl reductase family protein [Alcanivorax sp. 1008]